MQYRSPSRRTALRSALGTALALGCAGLGTDAAAAVTTAREKGGVFRDVRAFHGTWEGVYDGRRARLRMVVVRQSPGTKHTLYLTLADLDRDETFTGSVEDVPATSHMAGGIALRGSAALTLRALVLHTRDTDRLSGTSVRDGRGFPLSFRRSGTGPAYVQNRPFRDYRDWYAGDGRYTGDLDGRPAELTVLREDTREGTLIGFRLADLDRGMSWGTALRESEVRRWSRDRQRDPLAGTVLTPARFLDEPLPVDSLYWHGANTAYVSGASAGPGGLYGMSFVRRAAPPA
ncbi:hypothetical protein [Streptomyces sp. UNOB3_S3]|uniref:hypothetical protein n=1 Tax=Streptomyces sp. UNOB3_S3 TaxID=2871682 RepID=UPI001E330FE8|nr:hypothetical protein [Streptomyces sp. UNOB3_S3]MCC3776503.1 hypothetical protein [Streptomyces sp. UNOB3_S3]